MSLEGSIIREGSTEILVPPSISERGPGKRQGRVFFNRQMAFNRDVSVALFQSVLRPRRCLDAMAATGARGIRICHEAPGQFHFIINDKDPLASRYIEENVRRNSLENAESRNEDLRCLLAHEIFDLIDLDPFGTPIPFIPAALQGMSRKGVLAVTATDTASLSGTHPGKCRRRYMANSQRNPFMHESGLRIMMGTIVRMAAQEDKGVTPLLCYYSDHYFRLFLRVREGAGVADASLAQLGMMSYDPSTGRRAVGEGRMGPMWLGPLMGRGAMAEARVPEGLECQERTRQHFEIWKEELDVPFYYETNEIAAMLKLSPPNREELLGALGSRGHVSRTNFSPTGFRTDLPLEEVLETFRSVC
ncbi:MAG: N2,N2-dimethylguanosine tRNA methyltransferase [Methanomassiliicoccales archaeon]|nr:N2,N2-dimethylguanosine tRNA methyltransferase [Methanomassiliicoccales archaeon]